MSTPGNFQGLLGSRAEHHHTGLRFPTGPTSHVPASGQAVDAGLLASPGKPAGLRDSATRRCSYLGGSSKSMNRPLASRASRSSPIGFREGNPETYGERIQQAQPNSLADAALNEAVSGAHG